jgi:hypothetical protein
MSMAWNKKFIFTGIFMHYQFNYVKYINILLFQREYFFTILTTMSAFLSFLDLCKDMYDSWCDVYTHHRVQNIKNILIFFSQKYMTCISPIRHSVGLFPFYQPVVTSAQSSSTSCYASNL